MNNAIVIEDDRNRGKRGGEREIKPVLSRSERRG